MMGQKTIGEGQSGKKKVDSQGVTIHTHFRGKIKKNGEKNV